ncbi:single-stranded DNA-binding protein [Actinophytocola sp.]|uniref:single-stranded DNA-binding protein n=1 Tax=Actinophytocola sp. TaxID=1872138 RepID=UPI002ED23E40
MSINSTPITVVGRVMSDITARVTSTGIKVANFRLLTQEHIYDKETGTWMDGDRMYMTIVCWRRLAENVVECLHKSDQIVVHGRLKIIEYKAANGDPRVKIEVEAKALGPDLTLSTVTINRPDWAISPNQQTLVNPPPAQEPTQEEVAQAA